jgi:cytidine deaminase
MRSFNELTALSAYVAERLFHAYGPIPDQAQIREAGERVLDDLISIARDASVFSWQYRDFRVGAVALGLKRVAPQGSNPWGILFDANTKPRAQDRKWCAEQYLMDRMSSGNEAMKKVTTFVVVGKPQVDDDSRVSQITLTPCKECRDRMLTMAVQNESILDPETEVITANLENTGFRKIQRIRDLHRFHRQFITHD